MATRTQAAGTQPHEHGPPPLLPLAAAQARLGRPGRPRKPTIPGHSPGITTPEPRVTSGDERRTLAPQASALLAAGKEKAAATRQARKAASTAAVVPRLLDLTQAALYVACSPWTVRDLLANGTLRRVRVPLPNGGELRRVLLDREDLDQLIARCKA